MFQSNITGLYRKVLDLENGPYAHYRSYQRLEETEQDNFMMKMDDFDPYFKDIINTHNAEYDKIHKREYGDIKWSLQRHLLDETMINLKRHDNKRKQSLHDVVSQAVTIMPTDLVDIVTCYAFREKVLIHKPKILFSFVIGHADGRDLIPQFDLKFA